MRDKGSSRASGQARRPSTRCSWTPKRIRSFSTSTRSSCTGGMEKLQDVGTYEGGYRFSPMIAMADFGEGHRETLVRTHSAGTSREFLKHLQSNGLQFSTSYTLPVANERPIGWLNEEIRGLTWTLDSRRSRPSNCFGGACPKAESRAPDNAGCRPAKWFWRPASATPETTLGGWWPLHAVHAHARRLPGVPFSRVQTAAILATGKCLSGR